jgi:hypothetical protein
MVGSAIGMMWKACRKVVETIVALRIRSLGKDGLNIDAIEVMKFEFEFMASFAWEKGVWERNAAKNREDNGKSSNV